MTFFRRPGDKTEGMLFDTRHADAGPGAAARSGPNPAATASAPKALWISWERHRRTRELAEAFGASLFELTAPGGAVARYARLLVRTARLLIRERPDLLIIQCPSIVLAVWAIVLRPAGRYTLVADLHNEAVEPFNYSFRLYRLVLRWIQRTADVSLVTNAALQSVVASAGGRALVLPDKVPAVARALPSSGRSQPLVVFICTYAADEPYLDVIEAARLIDPAIRVYVTGNAGARAAELPSLPANVVLTGFLPEAAYVALLRDADVLIDLTRMENCLVCGAYEAVALGKPLVTSDTQALRAYFSRGAIYTRHDATSLAEAIGEALWRKDALAAEMIALRRELDDDWNVRHEDVRRVLEMGAR
jgi:glycosyltransferase involved in cell wall biosynthesis